MSIVFAIVGALIGVAVLREWGGLVLGALWGVLLARVLRLEREVRELGARVERAPAPTAPPPREESPRREQAPPPEAVEPGHTAAPPASPEVVEPPEPSPLPAAPRRAPGPVDRLVAYAVEFFTTGNVVLRVGLVVLFFGVAFLLKYAADRALLPIELRLSAVALGGIAMVAVGYRLTRRQWLYGVLLQGGGVGVLYLTVFAALRLYQLVPPAFAFGLLLALFAGTLSAAVGEAGGAYGGGTVPQTGEVSFQEADNDGDGVLTREEARRAGIERFEEGDRDGDGVLDRTEFSALEDREAAGPDSPEPRER